MRRIEARGGPTTQGLGFAIFRCAGPETYPLSGAFYESARGDRVNSAFSVFSFGQP